MVSMSPALIAELFGLDGLGTLLGAMYSSSAVSALLGPPAVGFAIDRGGYLWGAIIAGACGLAALLLLYPLPASSPDSLVSARAGAG
jgi:MFS family permease